MRHLGRTHGTWTRFVLIGALMLLIGAALSLSAPRPALAGYADIVIDAGSGEVLHATNADTANYPASLTKMMTLYLLFDALERGKVKLDQALPVSAHAAAQPATKLGLRTGSTIPVEKAILALVIQSANDVAMVVAEALGGSEQAFARKMTQTAQQLGMKHTVFRNPSGLPDAAQRTTARDMAVLALALMQDFPQYYDYFAVRQFKFNGRTYVTHNRIVQSYDGADGLKTGYTRASGYNLVTSATRDGRRLIGVVLGGKTSGRRDKQMVSLLDRGFRTPSDNGGVAVASGIIPAIKPPAEILVTSGDAGDSSDTTVAAASALDSDGLAAAIAATMTPAWAIQVGAYTRFEPAHLAASNAAQRLQGLVDQADVAVDASDGDNGKIYRARLVGLTRDEAQRACDQLSKLPNGCLVVRLDDAVGIGGND
jgi:D-alanyl-D-alanine carboxypeptidase